jgi:hypothetical protein
MAKINTKNLCKQTKKIYLAPSGHLSGNLAAYAPDHHRIITKTHEKRAQTHANTRKRTNQSRNAWSMTGTGKAISPGTATGHRTRQHFS